MRKGRGWDKDEKAEEDQRKREVDGTEMRRRRRINESVTRREEEKQRIGRENGDNTEKKRRKNKDAVKDSKENMPKGPARQEAAGKEEELERVTRGR